MSFEQAIEKAKRISADKKCETVVVMDRAGDTIDYVVEKIPRRFRNMAGQSSHVVARFFDGEQI